MRLPDRIITIVRTFLRNLSDASVAAFSAQSALFILMSFFPFIMLLLTVLRNLPFSGTELSLAFQNLLPESVNELLRSVVDDLNTKVSGAIISVTAVLALWSASRGILAIIGGLNSVYGIRETRSYLVLRLVALLYTFIFIILLVAMLSLLVFGNTIYHWIIALLPMVENTGALVLSIRFIAAFTILVFFFLCVYLFIPNRRSGFVNEIPGALLAAVGWVGFSYLFSYYFDHFSNYSYIYGSLTAVVLFVLWLYFCMYIIFLGAEVNNMFSAQLRRHFASRKARKQMKSKQKGA